jgi:FtsH-binding integral membrane protein
MKCEPPKESAPSSPQQNINGIVGLTLSVLGLVGWLVTFGVMLSFSYEDLTGDGQRDFLIQLGNLLTYLARVSSGLVGLLFNGFLSATGCIVSLIGLAYEPQRPARAGLAVGLAGLGVAAAVIVWRMTVWGVL